METNSTSGGARVGLGRLAGNLTTGVMALTAMACGSAASTPAADLAVQPPDLYGLDFKDSTYPPGPYAQSGSPMTGDVLPDFTFQGHWSPPLTTGNASTQPFGAVTLGMMHDSGAKYAILNLSAFW